MITIVVRNVYMYIDGDLGMELKAKLKTLLSFVVPGFKHTPRYKSDQMLHAAGKLAEPWDGTKTLVRPSKEGLQAPVGLLSYVRELFDDHKAPYQIRDERLIAQRTGGWGLAGFSARDYQEEVIQKALQKQRGVIKMSTGCHRIGQGILMFNGSVKKVEDVKVGDLLMGPDSKKRNVLELCRGTGQMYRIDPVKGKSFVVNEDHVLTLKHKDLIVDVSVKDWLDWPKPKKHAYKLFRVEKNKNVLINGFDTERLGVENYYGFKIDGDHRYLLDDFTVTHNSGKTETMIDIMVRASAFPAIFFVTSCDLLEQAYDRFSSYVTYNGQRAPIGRVGAGHCDIQPITIATVQSAQLALEGKFTKFDDESSTDKTRFDEAQKKAVADMIRESQFIAVDECFLGDVRVRLGNGKKEKISKLVDKKYSGTVMSFNQTTRRYEPKKVTGWIKKRPDNPIVRVCINHFGDVRCTSNHEFLTPKGYIAARDLKKGDFLYSDPGDSISVAALSDDVGNAYVMVSNVEKIRENNKYVYCLNVEDNHNFIANGAVVHNCQHTSADTIQSILNVSHKARFRFGLSASPWRDDGLDILIEACFGKRICDIDASMLIRNGYLLKPHITFHHFRQVLQPTQTFSAHYKAYVVENQVRNEWIARRALMHMERNRQTIVIVKWTAHAEILSALIPGAEVLTSSGEMKKSHEKRKIVLERMRRKELKCIIGTSLVDEGIDIPSAQAGIFAGGGKSSTRALQRVGRFIRKDKLDPSKDCAYIDEIFDHSTWLMQHARLRRAILETEREFDITDNRDTMRL